MIIPPVTALLVFFGVQLVLNHAKYTGKALVFTGSINVSDLTNPDNIMAQLPSVKNTVDIVVPEEKYVKITVKGNDEKSVEQDLRTIVADYNEKLQRHSKERLAVTNTYLSSLDERAKTLQTWIDRYNKKLNSSSLTPQQIESITDLLVEAQNDLTKTMETANRVRGDLAFYENPSVLSEVVAPSKSYAKEAVASGLVLGVFLTFIFLTLMKYVFDARRYYHG
ncbi:lipopolysaccharide biosynthesis protein [Anoxybacteroides amylolyticum]|uniref:lipopolysaccharide biosynthesis protein n=1 Tax=Anoxybacteroides amylolyticum TaxID=294699 RepID=UPI001EE77B62|nr:lipopolysaccharide biosynthesis protein [Anoxybacillus amylolyticus]